MFTTGIASLTPGGLAAARPGAKQGIEEAAGEFEALLLGEMLKSMRESAGGGWLGGGEDGASATMTELAEQHLAKAIIAGGGLGLRDTILRQLDPTKRGPAPETSRGAAGAQ